MGVKKPRKAPRGSAPKRTRRERRKLGPGLSNLCLAASIFLAAVALVAAFVVPAVDDIAFGSFVGAAALTVTSFVLRAGDRKPAQLASENDASLGPFIYTWAVVAIVIGAAALIPVYLSVVLE
jgi:hypothetical protein